MVLVVVAVPFVIVLSEAIRGIRRSGTSRGDSNSSSSSGGSSSRSSTGVVVLAVIVVEVVVNLLTCLDIVCLSSIIVATRTHCTS